MRRRGQKDHPPVRVPSQPRQKLEALLPPLVRADAGMRFVDDNEIRAAPGEAFAALLGLDVVEADDREGIGIEQGLGERQASLQPACRAGRDRDGFDPEAGLQLSDPLFDEMRRAEHRKRIHFTPIHQLAQDQARLDRLADADVIRDEQAGHRAGEGPSARVRAGRCEARRRVARLTGRDPRRGVGSGASHRRAARPSPERSPRRRQADRSGQAQPENFKRRIEDDRVVLAARERAESQNAVLWGLAARPIRAHGRGPDLRGQNSPSSSSSPKHRDHRVGHARCAGSSGNSNSVQPLASACLARRLANGRDAGGDKVAAPGETHLLTGEADAIEASGAGTPASLKALAHPPPVVAARRARRAPPAHAPDRSASASLHRSFGRSVRDRAD